MDRQPQNCPPGDMLCHCRVWPNYPECKVPPTPPVVEQIPTLSTEGLAILVVFILVIGMFAAKGLLEP